MKHVSIKLILFILTLLLCFSYGLFNTFNRLKRKRRQSMAGVGVAVAPNANSAAATYYEKEEIASSIKRIGSYCNTLNNCRDNHGQTCIGNVCYAVLFGFCNNDDDCYSSRLKFRETVCRNVPNTGATGGATGATAAPGSTTATGGVNSNKNTSLGGNQEIAAKLNVKICLPN